MRVSDFLTDSSHRSQGRPPARASIVLLIEQTESKHVFAELRSAGPPQRRLGFRIAWDGVSHSTRRLFLQAARFARHQLQSGVCTFFALLIQGTEMALLYLGQETTHAQAGCLVTALQDLDNRRNTSTVIQ
jgi:hypothetical protein